MAQEYIVKFEWEKETFPDRITMTIEGLGLTIEGADEAEARAKFDMMLGEIKAYTDSLGPEVFWDFLAERGIQATPVEESQPVTPALRMDKVLVA